jgi:hypothetical protein
MAALCWCGLAALVYWTEPSNQAALIAFLVVLFGAVFLTLAPILRGFARRVIRSRLHQNAAQAHATRQALMLAAFVVANVLLQTARAWSALNALLLLGIFVVVELVALARR